LDENDKKNYFGIKYDLRGIPIFQNDKEKEEYLAQFVHYGNAESPYKQFPKNRTIILLHEDGELSTTNLDNFDCYLPIKKLIEQCQSVY